MHARRDAGMATPQHTPRGRGFDSSLVYYGHENDYWTRRQGGCTVNSTDPEAKKPTSHLPCVDLVRPLPHILFWMPLVYSCIHGAPKWDTSVLNCIGAVERRRPCCGG